MSKVSESANVAIFHMQMNSRTAVQYIMRETGCTEQTAKEAVKLAVRSPLQK